MRTYVYICATDNDADIAVELCTNHGCPPDQIQRNPASGNPALKIFAYELEGGQPTAISEEDNAILVVGVAN